MGSHLSFAERYTVFSSQNCSDSDNAASHSVSFLPSLKTRFRISPFPWNPNTCVISSFQSVYSILVKPSLWTQETSCLRPNCEEDLDSSVPAILCLFTDTETGVQSLNWHLQAMNNRALAFVCKSQVQLLGIYISSQGYVMWSHPKWERFYTWWVTE